MEQSNALTQGRKNWSLEQGEQAYQASAESREPVPLERLSADAAKLGKCIVNTEVTKMQTGVEGHEIRMKPKGILRK